MRNSITKILAFILMNLVFVWIHRVCFQFEPIMALVSVLIHILVLIYFPYKGLKLKED
jgi:hypothetical protein